MKYKPGDIAPTEEIGLPENSAEDFKLPIDMTRLPKHIAIVLDGNGRYAQKRGLPRNAGHKAGADNLKIISEFVGELGIRYLTVYVFSTENWKRPMEEVSGIMKLLAWYLGDWESYIGGRDVRIKVLGDISGFDKGLQKKIRYVEEQTRHKDGLTLNMAMGYGGRNEIVQAAQKLAQRVQEGTLAPEEITEEWMAEQLYTAGMPDPDLIIRPGGELRLSNFLIWQAAYAELYFTDTLWPDFSKDSLVEAIYDFQNRHRRFGGL